jgi:hypothetical protein
MELDPELDPDPLARVTDPRILIRTKMSRIPNTVSIVLSNIADRASHYAATYLATSNRPHNFLGFL